MNARALASLSPVKFIASSLVATLAAAVLPAVVGAVRLPPDTTSDCRGQVPVIVASDEAAQSDIYSAWTLANAINTSCVVLAGPRGSSMPSTQAARLSAANPNGWIVGGTAAVPASKVSGQHTRLAGTNRWQTAELVGSQVSGPLADEVTSLRADLQALERRLDRVEGSGLQFPRDSISSIWAEIDLMQTDIATLKVGAAGRVTSTPTLGSSDLSGRVSALENKVDDMQGFGWSSFVHRSLYDIDNDLDNIDYDLDKVIGCLRSVTSSFGGSPFQCNSLPR